MDNFSSVDESAGAAAPGPTPDQIEAAQVGSAQAEAARDADLLVPEAPAPRAAPGSAPTSDAAPAEGEERMAWVWRQVRKRVFLKLPFSPGAADAMEAVVPIVLEDGIFVVGLSTRNFPLSCHLLTDHVKKTIENILRAAAGRPITFEVVEGTSMEDWQRVRERRVKAQEAVLAAAKQHAQAHHLEDMLSQIVGEIRQRVTCVKDRNLPQVRAQMLLDIAPTLADAEEMLLPNPDAPDAHEARRIMSRALDRVASCLDVQPIILAIEVERCRRQPRSPGEKPAPERASTLDACSS